MVPYFSQWGSPEWTARILDSADPCLDPRWTDAGFDDADAYRFWSWRLCGIACLRSVLTHRDGSAPSAAALLTEALSHGVYFRSDDGGVLGLIYRPFCAWVEAGHGLRAELLEHRDLGSSLDGRAQDEYLMLSVHPAVRTPDVDPPTNGGHLVLVTDHDERTLTFHNPSGAASNARDVVLERPVFERFHAGRGIRLAHDRR